MSKKLDHQKKKRKETEKDIKNITNQIQELELAIAEKKKKRRRKRRKEKKEIQKDYL